MAGKSSDIRPIVHKKFKCEVDKEYVDTEDIGMQYLAKTSNLSPFRKDGSLTQTGGLDFAEINSTPLASTNLPDAGTDFVLINFHSFSVDRDEKEITILVYSDGNRTKLFINPYFNPQTNFSNYNPNKDSTWIYEWLELTEFYEGSVDSVSGNVLTSNENFTMSPNYLKGWFIVHNDLPDSDLTKYNYIESFDGDDSFTLKANVSTWDDMPINTFKIYRFPVIHFYGANTPSPNLGYAVDRTVFNPIPTQFIYHQNQLRMPCGKDNRPLILSMIYKKHYFLGENEMSYDGFWFDFQQVPQVLYRSAISAYASSSVTGNPSIKIEPAPASPNSWFTSGSPTNYINISYVGNQPVSWVMYSHSYAQTEEMEAHGFVPYYQVAGQTHRIGLKWQGGQFIVMINNHFLSSGTTLEQLFQALTWNFQYTYPYVITPHGTMSTVITYGTGDVLDEYTFSPTAYINQAEADGNRTATNLFLGSEVYVAEKSWVDGDQANPFVLTAVYDERNEIILGHGRLNPDATDGNALRVKFNSWFNRRISSIRFYNHKKSPVVPETPAILGSSVYPYFKWDKKVLINETPLNVNYDIYDINKEPYGETTIRSGVTIQPTLGIKSYTWDNTAGYFFTIFKQVVQELELDVNGLQLISSLNRYIDEDITMNYTRGAFVGQTNGRLFILGVKNITENELFESGDNIIYSTLAAGVSAYDIFSRQSDLNIFVGDKDTLVDLKFYEGFLTAIKGTNVFAVDVNTSDELQYRVVKTQIGRGSFDANSICETPHGIVMPTQDGVYLISPRGSQSLLRSDNGRLNFYKEFFAGYSMSSAYYNAFDELLLFQTGVKPSITNYVMVYSFKYDAWTTLAYNTVLEGEGVNFIKATTNANKEVLVASVNGENHNILKFVENSSQYIGTDGETENLLWVCETPSLPYGDKILDILLSAFTLHYDTEFGDVGQVNLSIKRNQDNTEECFMLGSLTDYDNSQRFVQLLSNINSSDQVQIQLSNLGDDGNVQHFVKFNINSFIIWASFAPRQLTQSK
jgi:hypothetical protein